MVSAKDIPADKFINRLKEELKSINEVQPLAWAKFVKSGSHNQRPPEQEDFWYIRGASILRKIYLNDTIGVERFKTYFGGRKNRGHAPPRFRKASGSIIRKLLQQLEKAGFVEKGKKGRKLTGKGRKFLDNVAYEVNK